MSSPFDLDRFAPPPVRFKLRGVDYLVDGDPDVDTVARMLRIETAMDSDQAMDAAFEGKQLLLEMVRVHQPDVEDLRVSPREILTAFYLIMRGPSVAAAVARSLVDPDAVPAPPPGDGEAPVATADSAADGGEADGPLASVRRSRGRSSLSDGETAGDLVTGIAV